MATSYTVGSPCTKNEGALTLWGHLVLRMVTAVCCALCAVRCVLCAVYCVLCAVCVCCVSVRVCACVCMLCAV